MTRNQPPSEFTNRIKRRRVLPAACSAAAAVSLAGCGMFPMQQPASAPPTATQQQEAASKVQSFTSDIDQALDTVDRERLRAAAQKEKQAAAITPAPATTAPAALAAPAPASPASPAATPPIAPDSTPAPVILASSNGLPAAAAKIPANATPSPAAQPAPPPASAASPSAAPPTALASAAISPRPPVSPGAQNATSIITPMAPVAAAPASAMGAMTALAIQSQNVPPSALAAAPAASPLADAAAAEPTMDQALAVVRKNVSARPTLATALALALLDNDAAKSPGASPATTDAAQNLPDTDRKILTDLLAALNTMKTQDASAAATLAERAAPLLDAQKKWLADADLELPKLALASRVDSFGVYTPIDAKFEQGKRHTVIIYCEVANFAAKKGDDGWFTTDLEQQETLITDDGLLIWRPNAEDIQDKSMNQRHDFYLVKKLTIPENLAAGKYTLRMSVTDKNANKRAMVSMPIEIVDK